MDAGSLFIAGCLLFAWFALLLVNAWLIEYIIPAKWVDKLCNTIGWRVRWEEDEPLTVRRRDKNRVSYIRQMLQVWQKNNRLFSKKR